MSDDEVESLARALRLAEASDLARDRGDLRRAFELAIERRDYARAQAIAATAPASARDSLAAVAIRRKDAVAEGLVAEASGNLGEAAACYERGGELRRAARSFIATGEVARAARAFERHLAAHAEDFEVRLALAQLLLDAHKAEPALRLLDRTAPGVPERDDHERAAQTLRQRALVELGLADATDTDAKARADGSAQREGENAHGGIKRLFGRYEVVRELSTSPSARVIEAVDLLAPQRDRVALKIFSGVAMTGAGRDALARFHREMAILSSLDAPGVLHARQLYDDGPTIVLPFMAGGSLAEAIARGPMPPSRIAQIVSTVLAALEAAHRRGVVHRDVKPSNILLDALGAAYLVDFGVAHLGDPTSTATAGVVGTLRWMSPEQRRGEPATPRSDLYAVGLVLAAGLGIDANALSPALPPAAFDWISAMVAEDPAQRPADAREAREALARIPWPEVPIGVRLRSSAPPPSGRQRFVRVGERFRDELLERFELRIEPDDARARLVAALVTLDLMGLPRVLGSARSDRDGSFVLRVEDPQESWVGPLDAHAHAIVREALFALHARAVAHGAVATSVRSTMRGPLLAIPSGEALARASVEDDLRQLAELLGKGPPR